jgi:hypothetical protein
MSSNIPEFSAIEGSESCFDHARHLLLASFFAAIEANNIPDDLLDDEAEATFSAMQEIIRQHREVRS